MITKLLRRLLGCSRGAISWRYGFHDFDTIHGRSAYHFWSMVDYWRERPRVWRWVLANRLAWMAARLRGNRLYDVGWGAESNLAGMCADSLRIWIVLHGEGIDDWEGPTRDLETLESLAKSISYIGYEKVENERNLETVDL